jgi:hypothetical protein
MYQKTGENYIMRSSTTNTIKLNNSRRKKWSGHVLRMINASIRSLYCKTCGKETIRKI